MRSRGRRIPEALASSGSDGSVCGVVDTRTRTLAFEGIAPKDIKLRFLIDRGELREEEELTRSNRIARTAIFILEYDGQEHPLRCQAKPNIRLMRRCGDGVNFSGLNLGGPQARGSAPFPVIFASQVQNWATAEDVRKCR